MERAGIVIAFAFAYGAFACGRTNNGMSGVEAQPGAASGASMGAASSDPPTTANTGTPGPRPTILPLPTNTPPTLPPNILAPIIANTASQPFPVSPSCAGYTFENAESDTTAMHVQRGWGARCKAVLEDARKDLATNFPAFANATVEAEEDKPSDTSRLRGFATLALPEAAPGRTRGSAAYTVEWRYARKNLGPFCPYTAAHKKPRPGDDPRADVYPVSLQRLYRVGSGLLRLDGFPSDTVSSIALRLEAALDRCAAIARRGT